ncbi:beta-glucosidase family 9 [Flavobacterium resistens]|uniref:Beta-glucosidase family 9 n=1 Tax=Flavobacterium resistens TaxID=443612 RepID=A0A521DFL9_9FLAO|nr:glycoside hydrolase family 9 protein [Flavobacterium resistens]MRX68862.1 glycosyl transferase [Flavobacterium resistens]SMO69730.1 beta-glucosidase family 9 [Flavobacterium resistens]
MLKLKYIVITLLFSVMAYSGPIIYVNQVGFDPESPKVAIIGFNGNFSNTTFDIIDTKSQKTVFTSTIGKAENIEDWMLDKSYYKADFSSFKKPGNYKITIKIADQIYNSASFSIEENILAKRTISSIVHYYNKQRANTPEELEADKNMLLFGSTKKVDVHGGWCDASGDVSKYFSHLAYANFVSPQQTPLVTWSLINTSEEISKELIQWKIKDSLDNEAIWGADYMMRCLSDEDYFYMIVFSYFDKNPAARRIVGLKANSVTTDEYQSAFREGAGMAIASLARISQWKKNGDFTSKQYLDGAKRAYAHLLINNTKYDDDGKENIIDDYCALMGATELWIATNENFYKEEARKWAHKLENRMTDQGWFRSNDGNRPFWHAADAGLPIVALTRYLKKESDENEKIKAKEVIKKALNYNLAVTNNVSNPFGYARQSFLFNDKIKDGFFIPHENETGWWWQGENARLASLATAATEGGKAISLQKNDATKKSLDLYASQQLSWILGCNPYSVCFLYQFGEKNVPYMHSNYGHGSEKGGISNGITGKEGNGDGSGIDFKMDVDGNDEWRWTEQWIPHSAWFLQAITATVNK